MSDDDDDSAFNESYQTPNEAAWINNLAIRCFRDVGDGDYIAARLALRAGLASQFLWSGLQALEKYLKCILLLGRVDARKVGHRISTALQMANEKLELGILLPENERKIFQHIAESEGDRYLVSSLHIFEHELSDFDSLVWRLRQYCVPLDIKHYNDPPSKALRREKVASIELALQGKSSGGYILGGMVETVLAKNNHPARDGLVWRNAMFGEGKPVLERSGISGFIAVNSPLYLHPEIARTVSQWIYLPKGAVEAFETLAEAKSE